jgi:hypothetical protein
VRTVAEIEERMSEGRRARSRRRRQNRVLLGLIAAMLVAGAGGLMLGRSSHRTRDEILAEQAQQRGKDKFISGEVNRTLLELWKMEDVEALRNRGRTR